MPVLYLSDPASPLAMQLAANIRRRSKELRMTQAELSERSGVAATHISHIARGKANPTLSTLARISDGLGLSVIELLAPDSTANQAEPGAPLKMRNGER